MVCRLARRTIKLGLQRLESIAVVLPHSLSTWLIAVPHGFPASESAS